MLEPLLTRLPASDSGYRTFQIQVTVYCGQRSLLLNLLTYSNQDVESRSSLHKATNRTSL